MKLDFYKYQATGNDFVMIDGRISLNLKQDQIVKLCDRHFGVGSDGVLIVEDAKEADFRMIFYNPDGTRATFCGNGARCIVKFANQLGIVGNYATFVADDGLHNAEIIDQLVKLKMKDVADIVIYDDLIFLNTGTNHVVKLVEDVDQIDDICSQARPVRYDKRFAPIGTNVNFLQIIDNETIKIRTYEKGVENETLSCGTGTVASALASFVYQKSMSNRIKVKTRGGELIVNFDLAGNNYFKNVYLSGNAQQVFFGSIEI